MDAKKETKKERVHGFLIEFDEELKDGIRYLRDDLQYGEAKTLFDAARFDGEAEFEDDYDRDWTIIYNRGKDTYSLVRRQRE